MGYKSDLTDAEWALLEQDFRPRSRRGSGCKHAVKTVVNAILYVVKGGSVWRMLLNDFPRCQTVYDRTNYTVNRASAIPVFCIIFVHNRVDSFPACSDAMFVSPLGHAQ